ncbi:hypothetical protein COOONC_08623 [Cooperia oncophora]
MDGSEVKSMSNIFIPCDEYDAHIKKNKPALHAKLVKMRRDYLEMEPKNSQASNFIGEVYKTARLVRRKMMDAPTEAKTILDHFNGMTQEARQMLIDKYPVLQELGTFKTKMGK